MKITIDLSECPNFGLSPNCIYRSLWGMATAYDSIARELYAHKTGRSKNVKNLMLTYTDAEACFELFKQFADVWSKNCLTSC